MTRYLILILIALLSASCSYVPSLDSIIPDKRQEYKKSESLPDLEVPPDLTAEGVNDSMDIPGEGASLSQYQKKRNGVSNNTATVATSSATADADEQWVSVYGKPENI